MLWLNFIHLYQPANSDQEKITEAVSLSYERLLRLLEENKNLQMTANITGGLLERLSTDLKRQDILARLKKLIKAGRLELVGSAAYHALLPLISESEVISQIKEQEILLERHLAVKKPRGFFLPELAYSPKVAKIIKSLGYQWLIVDEITAFGHLGRVSSEIFLDQNSGLKIIVRNREISESYVPEKLLDLIKASDRQTVITATDAELYGLRHHDERGILEALCINSKLYTENLSSYIEKFTNLRTIKLIASNWQSTEKELLIKKPFALWQDKNNQVHNDLWVLAKLAQKLFYQHHADENIWWSRWHLSRGLQSCCWWWASRYDFRQVYGPLAWSPDEVERGVNELIRSIRSLQDSTSLKTKIMAEKLAQKIRTEVWLKHWQ